MPESYDCEDHMVSIPTDWMISVRNSHLVAMLHGQNISEDFFKCFHACCHRSCVLKLKTYLSMGFLFLLKKAYSALFSHSCSLLYDIHCSYVCVHA